MKLAHPTIEQFMTAAPHTIGRGQPLARAHELMRTHRLRHLPVLDAGKLVGVVSERDLYFIETLRGVDPETVPVEEAMSPSVYQVSAGARLEEVATEMVEHKYGCAVVMEGDRVAGLFTTVDALRALVAHLRSGARRPR